MATIGSAPLSAERSERNTPTATTVFLMVVYISLAIIAPLLEYLGIAAVSLLPWDLLVCKQERRFRRLCIAVDTVGAFASFDVNVMALLIALNEWTKLVGETFDGALGDTCPSGVDCISQEANAEMGFAFIVTAIVLGWLLEAFFTAELASLFRPHEKVREYDRFLACWPWSTADVKTQTENSTQSTDSNNMETNEPPQPDVGAQC